MGILNPSPVKILNSCSSSFPPSRLPQGAVPKGNATKEFIESLQLKPGQVVYKCPKCCSIKPDRAHHCRYGTPCKRARCRDRSMVRLGESLQLREEILRDLGFLATYVFAPAPPPLVCVCLESLQNLSWHTDNREFPQRRLSGISRREKHKKHWRVIEL